MYLAFSIIFNIIYGFLGLGMLVLVVTVTRRYIINDRENRKRRALRDEREREYHEKRMNSLNSR